MESDEQQTGVIKNYFSQKNYGFIIPDLGGNDIFFYRTSCPLEPVRGARVSFVVRQGPRGPQAQDIEITSAPEPAEDGNRQIGEITAYNRERNFGFIHPETGEADIFFHRTSRPLEPVRGAKVSFVPRPGPDGRPQAQHIEFLSIPEPTLTDLLPQPNGRLFDWAYLGNMPEVLELLKTKTLEENWSFRDSVSDSDRQYPILASYLFNTFARLVKEDKVVISDDRTLAAFNTGLVDNLYEPIYAVFRTNPGRRVPWWLTEFCRAGERGAGQELMRKLTQLPVVAQYFDDPAELLYDPKRVLTLVWEHVVLERLDRLPWDFLEDKCPRGFSWQDPKQMTIEERQMFFRNLSEAIKLDHRTYRAIIGDLDQALELTKKRVSWNFKTAIPQYYTREHKLQLLLPLCIVSEQRVDVALAVERMASGYLGHTIFPLGWAYMNARLICRPDSDWLNPSQIEAIPEIDEDLDEED